MALIFTNVTSNGRLNTTRNGEKRWRRGNVYQTLDQCFISPPPVARVKNDGAKTVPHDTARLLFNHIVFFFGACCWCIASWTRTGRGNPSAAKLYGIIDTRRSTRSSSLRRLSTSRDTRYQDDDRVAAHIVCKPSAKLQEAIGCL